MRLIDAEALKFTKVAEVNGVLTHVLMAEDIDNAPTVIWCSETSDGLPLMDLRPRPQGEWIKKVDDVGFISHICSNCGSEIEVEDPCDDKFCYSCGAKMKGGVE